MLLDIDYQLRNNSNYRSRFFKLLREHNEAAEECETYGATPARKKRVEKVTMELIHHTDFNLAPFLPYYFPDYPKGKPFTLNDHSFAYPIYNSYPYMNLCIRGSRQIAKTTNIMVKDVIATQVFPRLKVGTIAPHPEQVRTLANKLKEVIESFRLFKHTKGFRQNLSYREFPNKSFIKFAYVLTSATGIRGNSFDILNLDEAQDFNPSLEVELFQVLSDSDRKSVIVSGTSLTTDSYLEHRFLSGSQAFWMMKCDSCGHYNVPTPEGDVIDMIGPNGPVCVKCKHPLDVRKGFWEHTRKQALEAAFISLHVPKIIVPHIAEHPGRWDEIYRLSRDEKLRNKFYMEILGIPTEEGSKEITKADLINICVLGDRSEIQAKAKKKFYRYITSGADWGGSDHKIKELRITNSTTTHAMMGVTVDGYFDILHLERLPGMDYNSTVNNMSHKHHELGGFAFGCDFGGGLHYIEKLIRKVETHRFWCYTYTSPNASELTQIKGSRYNHLGLNRTEAVSRTFDAIRTGRIRCFKWEQAESLLEDFTNIVRSPERTSGTGAKSLQYRVQSGKSDDIAMAVVYAYHTGLLLLGERFTDNIALLNYVREQMFRNYNHGQKTGTSLPLIYG